MSADLATFAPWQQRIYAQAAAALDAGQLGHAQLFCGPAGLGKLSASAQHGVLRAHLLVPGAHHLREFRPHPIGHDGDEVVTIREMPVGGVV